MDLSGRADQIPLNDGTLFKSQNWYFLTYISISILVWILWSTETLILNLFCTRKYYKQKTQNQSFSYLLQIFDSINNRDPQPEIYEEIKREEELFVGRKEGLYMLKPVEPGPFDGTERRETREDADNDDADNNDAYDNVADDDDADNNVADDDSGMEINLGKGGKFASGTAAVRRRPPTSGFAQLRVTIIQKSLNAIKSF